MATTLVGCHAGRDADVYDAYIEHMRRTDPSQCPFCAAHDTGSDEIEDRNDTMLVLRNRFPYAVWDSAHVEDHLMVVPARHLLSLDEFNNPEALDFFTLIRRYEAAGYSVYSRSPANKGRSVGHVHTHLLKTGAWYQSDALRSAA